MAKISLYEWFKKLDDPVPVQMIAPLTRLAPARVNGAIDRGELRVHTFRASTGKVFRVVTRVDLQKFCQNQRSRRRMQEAMLKVFKRWVHS